MFGVEGQFPATCIFGAGLAGNTLPHHGAIEMMQDLLAVETQRIEQRGDRQLALAVDTDIDDVLGVEFEIEPGTAIGNHAGGEQELARGVGLAAVMIEQHTGRTVHLADDHTLGAVDDESAVLGHERHVAHVDILLLDIEDGAGFGFGVDLEHDQAQRHLHRRGIGDAALAAFGGVVFRVFQLVMDEIELGGAGEIADREDRPQGLFQPRDVTDGGIGAQELFVAFALDLDQVRHLHHFVDVAENLADTLLRAAARSRSFRRRSLWGRHGRGVPLSLLPGPGSPGTFHSPHTGMGHAETPKSRRRTAPLGGNLQLASRLWCASASIPGEPPRRARLARSCSDRWPYRCRIAACQTPGRTS